jgi:hypothetical protein
LYNKYHIFTENTEEKEMLQVKHNSEDIYRMIEQMDNHLRTELLKKDDKVQEEKLWENTYIKRQIDKRKDGGVFTVSDHIRAVVYSLLSGGHGWAKYAKEMDIQTGCIPCVDSIFHDYSPIELLKCSPFQLYEELQKIHLAPRFGTAPIEKLITVNIPKLLKLEEEYGTVDNYYQKYIQEGINRHPPAPVKPLIEALSDAESNDKLEQMGIPLVCEYLRNVGYDLPKPDTHICRILGSEILGFSTSKEVSEYKSIEIIFEIAKVAKKSVAETDYILWSYCSNGYGEICTSKNPKCNVCVAVGLCRNHEKNVVTEIKNRLLLNSHFKIKEYDDVSRIICKASDTIYSSLCSRIIHDYSISAEDGVNLKREVGSFLADRIPELLESADQKIFDESHHAICKEIVHMFSPKCQLKYGIAQRWLNETLINLIIIESSLPVSILPVAKARRYFHVAVDRDILQVATVQRKEVYHHGLGLKCAPLRHEDSAVYEMDWFHQKETQPYMCWEYEEYIEFQNAVRDVLKKPIKDGIYKDVLDWSFQALVEK